MAERVIDAQLCIRWSPNVEHAVLIAHERGPPRILSRAHFDDPDQRRLNIVCPNAAAASIEQTTDEAISGHPQYAAGLRHVHWVGEIHDSTLISELERRNRFHEGHNPTQYSALSLHDALPI